MSQGESSVVEWRLSNFILQLAKDSLSFFPGQECKELGNDSRCYCTLKFLGLAGGMTTPAAEVAAPARFDKAPYIATAPIVPLNAIIWNW